MERISSAYKSKTIYMGLGDSPSFFPPDIFPDPKKEGCPSFFAKISNFQ